MIIRIESKLDISKLQKLLKPVTLLDNLCKGLIIEIGRFYYSDEEEE